MRDFFRVLVFRPLHEEGYAFAEPVDFRQSRLVLLAEDFEYGVVDLCAGTEGGGLDHNPVLVHGDQPGMGQTDREALALEVTGGACKFRFSWFAGVSHVSPRLTCAAFLWSGWGGRRICVSGAARGNLAPL